MSLDENKKLNGELDRLLVLINEYELINKELIDEIEIYSDQDQQAIAILNRREQMRELISGTVRKFKLTEETIQHIKYWRRPYLWSISFYKFKYLLSKDTFTKLKITLLKEINIVFGILKNSVNF